MATHVTRKSMAMGPTVRNLLNHYQLDPSRIISTGPHQTILKCDVLAYIHQQNLKPAEPGQSDTSSTKVKTFRPNLDTSGYQPKPGPEGFSEIAKKLLGR